VHIIVVRAAVHIVRAKMPNPTRSVDSKTGSDDTHRDDQKRESSTIELESRT